MKKFILGLFTFLICSSPAFADNQAVLPYKNIKEGAKLYCIGGLWTSKGVKDTEYFVKAKTEEGKYVFNYPDGETAFSSDCDYEFIYDGRLIGYSNSDLKFYEISLLGFERENTPSEEETESSKIQYGVYKSALSPEEVQKIFPERRIVRISDFSENTNSIKLKKRKGALKIILFNDTESDFADYVFTTGNSRFKTYMLNGLIDIEKAGMVQFAKRDDVTKSSPWFVILAR